MLSTISGSAEVAAILSLRRPYPTPRIAGKFAGVTGKPALVAPTNNAAVFGVVDAVRFDPTRQGFQLPSGLWQRYDGLRKMTDPEGKAQYEYPSRKGPVKMYGGKLVENICQAVARCVIAEQMLRIGKRYKVVLTVHDAVACIAPETEAKEAQDYVEQCMRWRPIWCQALPLNCESGVGKSYGDC